MLVPEFIVFILEIPVNCTVLTLFLWSVMLNLSKPDLYVLYTNVCNVPLNRHRPKQNFFFSVYICSQRQRKRHRSQLLYSTHLVVVPLSTWAAELRKSRPAASPFLSRMVRRGWTPYMLLNRGRSGQLHICYTQFTCCHLGLVTIIPEIELWFCHKITYLVFRLRWDREPSG